MTICPLRSLPLFPFANCTVIGWELRFLRASASYDHRLQDAGCADTSVHVCRAHSQLRRAGAGVRPSLRCLPPLAQCAHLPSRLLTSSPVILRGSCSHPVSCCTLRTSDTARGPGTYRNAKQALETGESKVSYCDARACNSF